MRKIVGSILIGFASLAFSVSASAQLFSGTGNWMNSTGASGEYTADVTLAHIGQRLNITNVIKVNGNTMTFSFSLQTTSGSFFDVYDANNQVVGNGYCFPTVGIPGQKVCHSDSVTGGFQVESTVKVTATKIYRMGSKTNLTTGEKLAWKDELTATGCGLPQ